jgi:hypothetical protein
MSSSRSLRFPVDGRGILTHTEPDIQNNIKEDMLCRKKGLVILTPKSLRKAG